MGVLQRFERRLGGLVEGAFAKVFKGGVEPVEIASALARETDDRRAISANRTLVPNEFAVELATGDYTRLAPYQTALCDELAAMVREHATEQRYTFVGPVSIRLAEATDLDIGVFRIRSSVAAAEAGGFPGRNGAARPRRPAVGRPRLLISTKPGPDGAPAGSEREFVLDTEVATIGRSVECEIRVNDTGVSRKHAEVRRMPDGRHVFADLGSTNGSIVNGRPATQARLSDGDRIEVGNTILLFRSEDQRPRGEASRPAAPARAMPVDPRPVEPRRDDPRRDDPRYRGALPPAPGAPGGGYGSDPYRGSDPARPADPYGDQPYRDQPYRDDPYRGGGETARPADPYQKRPDPYDDRYRDRPEARPAPREEYWDRPAGDPYSGSAYPDADETYRDARHRRPPADGRADPPDNHDRGW